MSVRRSVLLLLAGSIVICLLARVVAARMMMEAIAEEWHKTVRLFIIVGVVPAVMMVVARDRRQVWGGWTFLTLVVVFSYLFTGGWSDRA